MPQIISNSRVYSTAIQHNNRSNIRAVHNWSLLRVIHWWPMNYPLKDQHCGNWFHIIQTPRNGMVAKVINGYVNMILLTSDTTWLHIIGLVWAQVMVCCLRAPSITSLQIFIVTMFQIFIKTACTVIWIEDLCASSRWEGQEHVITSLRNHGMQLLIPVPHVCFWHRFWSIGYYPTDMAMIRSSKNTDPSLHISHSTRGLEVIITLLAYI